MADSFARCVSVSTLWAATEREQGPKTQPGRAHGPGPKVTDALGSGPVSWAHWKQPPLDAQSDNTDTGEKRKRRPDRAGARQYSLGDGEGSIPLRGTEGRRPAPALVQMTLQSAGDVAVAGSRFARAAVRAGARSARDGDRDRCTGRRDALADRPAAGGGSRAGGEH